jgi:hypothetical protein
MRDDELDAARMCARKEARSQPVNLDARQLSSSAAQPRRRRPFVRYYSQRIVP